MKLKEIPGRVLLDTCVVNFILDFCEQIYDGASLPPNLSERAIEDVSALCNLFLTGQRAAWQLAVSPCTYHEVIRTADLHRRQQLEFWFSEIWDYWMNTVDQSSHVPSPTESESLRSRILTSGELHILPDPADRVLICDAVAYRCNLFCTRDWTTILKHRARLHKLPFEIVTPTEWWSRIEPWADLWI